MLLSNDLARKAPVLMPWTNPPTFTANTVLKAPTMNSSVRDNLWTLGHERPAARLQAESSFQSVLNNSATTVQYSKINWASTGSIQTFGAFLPLQYGDRLIVTVPGLYMITGTVEFSANANNTRAVDCYQNRAGTNELMQTVTGLGSSAITTTLNFCYLSFYMSVGDYFFVQAFQNSGATLTLGTKTSLSYALLTAI